MKKQLAYNRQERQRKIVIMDSVGKGIEKKIRKRKKGEWKGKGTLIL